MNITLNGTSAECTGTGVSISESKIEISAPGTYVLSGSFTGRIVINAESKGTVRIILNEADITSLDNCALEVQQASKTIVTAYKDTENSISVSSESTDTETTAAIYSKDDLVINGSGTLTVEGSANDGITSKDDLYIVNANITVTAEDDGIIGKDTLYLTGSAIDVTCNGDAFKSSNETDTGEGNLLIDSGTYTLTAGDDCMQSVNGTVIHDGTFTLKAGEGSSAAVHTEQQGGGFAPFGQGTADQTNDTDTSSEESSKGIVTAGSIKIDGGDFTMDTQDDAIHADSCVTVSAGTFSMNAGDDGIHADDTLLIDGGEITIATCYEGLEAKYITINDGTIDITASDDGINAADPNVSGDTMQSDDSYLTIAGGSITVYADGDGLDMNGNGIMTGGNVVIYGPSNDGNGALDYGSSFTVNGGTLIAGGTTGMMQTPSEDSTLYTLSIGTSSGTTEVKDSNGNTIATYTTDKTCTVVTITCEAITSGSTYTVYKDGSEVGTMTVSSKTTSLNVSSSGMQGGMGQGGGMQGGPGGNSGTQGQGGSGSNGGQQGQSGV